MQEDVYRGDGLNLYAYCRNNPVIYYNPSGYSHGNKEDNVQGKTTQKNGADTLPENIVQRGVTSNKAASIESGIGIQKPTPAHRTTPTQHVWGRKHSRDPYTSTTRSNDTAPFTRNAVAADQEVLIRGGIPPEAIVEDNVVKIIRRE